MNAPASRLTLIVLAAITLSARAQTPPAPSVPMCQANQLSLATDDEDGSFNGMSHSGTLLVLRNIASNACRLAATPQLSFEDSAHTGVAIALEPKNNPFRGPVVNGRHLPMGHGPVVIPIVIAPGAEATATLTWVSNDVYDHGTCLTPATILVKVDAATLHAPFDRHVCGADPAHVTITFTRFALDPVYKP